MCLIEGLGISRARQAIRGILAGMTLKAGVVGRVDDLALLGAVLNRRSPSSPASCCCSVRPASARRRRGEPPSNWLVNVDS